MLRKLYPPNTLINGKENDELVRGILAGEDNVIVFIIGDNSMAKYKVVRIFIQNIEYAYVEANSKDDAEQKAIDNNCWEKFPTDEYHNCEYLVGKEED